MNGGKIFHVSIMLCRLPVRAVMIVASVLMATGNGAATSRGKLVSVADFHMSNVKQDAMLDVLKKRHSVRNFAQRDVSHRDLQEILRAADSAPSAGGLKAREVFAVHDGEIKKLVARAAFGQDFVAQAPVVLVFWAVASRSAAKYGERGRELYSVQDATIAASFAWLQAVSLGLGACWVGAFDEAAVKRIFRKDIREDWRPIALLPIGYPAESAAHGNQ